MPAQARPAGEVRPEGLRDLQPPQGPGGLRRPDRRAARGDPPRPIWGDGDPEGVRQRAAEEMKMTARAARRLGVDDGRRLHRLVDLEVRRDVPAGVGGDGRRRLPATSPTAGTRSSTCSTSAGCGSRTRCTRRRSPTTTGRPCARWRRSATGRRSASTGTPATWSGRTSTRSASCGTSGTGSTTWTARTRSSQIGNGRNGRLGSHLPWADPRRGWDFVSTGHGDVPWEQCFRMLNTIGYDGPISVEWEDAGMDRLRRRARGAGVRAAPRLRRSGGCLRRGVCD